MTWCNLELLRGTDAEVRRSKDRYSLKPRQGWQFDRAGRVRPWVEVTEIGSSLDTLVHLTLEMRCHSSLDRAPRQGCADRGFDKAG